jgi:diadenylate cyclase
MDSKELLNILSQVTPGTTLREGVDNILDAGSGALILVGFNEDIAKVVDGGFYINCDYTPQKIYELAKMDGAIILDDNVDKILYANVHLQPDKKYETQESGTRHRTAQRVAKQTGKLVIAISERKKVVTLYKGEQKYRLKDIREILSEVSQALKTLERYRYVLDSSLANLTILELDDLVTIYEVASVLQRFEMIYRIKEELKNYVIELGSEGRLINLQLQELLFDLKEEKRNFIRDYYNYESDKTLDMNIINRELGALSDIELLELENLSAILGYGKSNSILDDRIKPKGYRVLGKISKLNKRDVEKMISIYGDLATIQETTAEELNEIKGISKFKIRAMKNGLKRLKTTVELEK